MSMKEFNNTFIMGNKKIILPTEPSLSSNNVKMKLRTKTKSSRTFEI